MCFKVMNLEIFIICTLINEIQANNESFPLKVLPN